MHVTVYRSTRKEGMYVYLANEEGLAELPDAVKNQLGEPEFALSFELQPGRELPHADAVEVREALENQGFYIQMPKDIEAMLAEVSGHSAKR